MVKKAPIVTGQIKPVMPMQPQMAAPRPIAPVPSQPMVRPPVIAPPHIRVASPNLTNISQAARLAETLKRMSKV